MDQVVQMIGAILVLIGFAGVQLKKLDPHSLTYIVVNLVGSAALAVVAAITSNWGFLLMEGVWAIVSARSLIRWTQSRPRA
jgi:membrane-bound ClpP family serine protease